MDIYNYFTSLDGSHWVHSFNKLNFYLFYYASYHLLMGFREYKNRKSVMQNAAKDKEVAQTVNFYIKDR